MPAAERRRLPGIEEKRADLLPAGVTLLTTIFDVFEIHEMVTSDWALREGIVLDKRCSCTTPTTGRTTRWLRRVAVAGLARRCGSDVEHSKHIATLALSLFDQTQSLHSSAPTIARCSSSPRCCTTSVSTFRGRATTATPRYLVENAQLRGFAPDEIEFLAALVRHHRRGDIKLSEPRRPCSTRLHANACESWPHCCDSPTDSTAAAAV